MVESPAFAFYTWSMIVLCLNVLGLWGYSGSARAKTKTTPNEEDLKTVSKDATKESAVPESVARVLRAHANAQANIWPFAILGFLFVAWGGSLQMTQILCGVFVAARLLHSIVYLAGKQPWRTLMFIVGGLDTLVLVAMLARQVLAAAPPP